MNFFKWMFLPFKRYAEFSGRSRRTEYWSFTLFFFLCAQLVSFPLFYMMTEAMFSLSPYEFQELVEEEPETLGEGLMLPLRMFGIIFQEIPKGPLIASLSAIALFWLGIVMPTLALNVRRFRDCNIEPKWYWLCLVSCFMPFFGGIGSLAILIIAGFLPGTPGPNQFGDNPREEETSPLPTDEPVPPPPQIWPAS